MTSEIITWLLASDEPWTHYCTRVDLLDQPEGHPDVRSARAEMLSHPKIKELIKQAASWPGYAIKRHNDANHLLYKISTLADFGLRVDDPGILIVLQPILEHQSPQGSFQIQINVPKTFGGSGNDIWAWVLCDAPTLLYSLLAMGLGDDPNVKLAVEHLVSLSHDNGWRCSASPEMGSFRGPGRKSDPCPIANVYALKALSQVPDKIESPASRKGVEALLSHWEKQNERKIYLFGIGTDFRKLKYPYVWYDILHVVDVLSLFPYAHSDSRLQDMVSTITSQADDNGHFTAKSMYRAWKDWSFADKKRPSPWLTFLVMRIIKRLRI